MAHKTVYDHALATVRAHEMAGADAFAVAMVSGGSDSCALAYVVSDMVAAGELGAAVMLHVNHTQQKQNCCLQNQHIIFTIKLIFFIFS